MWCWRRLLRVPWTARRSNQSILKEINPKCSLEGLMLKLQYSGHLMRRMTHGERPWSWERARAGGEGDSRGWDGWMASPTRWTWAWANYGRYCSTGRPGVLQPVGSQSQTRPGDCTAAGHQWGTLTSSARGRRVRQKLVPERRHGLSVNVCFFWDICYISWDYCFSSGNLFPNWPTK